VSFADKIEKYTVYQYMMDSVRESNSSSKIDFMDIFKLGMMNTMMNDNPAPNDNNSSLYPMLMMKNMGLI